MSIGHEHSCPPCKGLRSSRVHVADFDWSRGCFSYGKSDSIARICLYLVCQCRMGVEPYRSLVLSRKLAPCLVSKSHTAVDSVKPGEPPSHLIRRFIWRKRRRIPYPQKSVFTIIIGEKSDRNCTLLTIKKLGLQTICW